MTTIGQDLRFGWRLLAGNPGFTAVAVLTLTIGIAANTTVFSWVDGILLHPFPGASKADELAILEMIRPRAPNGATQVTYVDYKEFRDNLKSLAGLAAHREEVVSLGDSGDRKSVWGELVSGNYFEVLGVKPAAGRFFTPEENGDELGAHRVAVISHRLWEREFQRDPRIVGRNWRVNNHELTVVGVAAPEFRGTMPGLSFDIWIPVTMAPRLGFTEDSSLQSRGNGSFGLYAIARLKPESSLSQARAEAAIVAGNLGAAYPERYGDAGATVLPVWEFHSGATELLGTPLRMLMGITLLLLLIVCANVANLLLARSVTRRKELTIRLALGATGGRLFRQLLTESLLLAGAASVCGLVLSSWLGDLLPALVPDIGASLASGFAMNRRVLAWTILSCVAAALLAGFIPALLWFRGNSMEKLKEGGRGGSEGVGSQRTRSVLVVSEVALATVALIGAVLFVRSFRNANSIYPGFDSSRVLLARFYQAGTGMAKADLERFCGRLQRQLEKVPGVESVAYADNAPLGGGAGPYHTVAVEGYLPALGESMSINRYLVGPGYFQTLRIPLLDGRDFSDNDREATVIVNESFARRFFPGGSAIGRRVRFRGVWGKVIGVVKDSKYFQIAEAHRPHFFASFRQFAGRDQQLYFFIKTVGDPGPLAARIRREVAAVDETAGAFDLMRLTSWTSVALLPQKVAASLTGAIGIAAALLAAVGLYSVLAYSVSQRTREIGIRMALGAPPSQVLLNVLKGGFTLTVAGVAVGIASGLAAAKLARSMLVELSPDDPWTFLLSGMLLLAISFLASYVPARRSTRVDPVVALRVE